ncbi:hypothetical protein Tbd_0897 [Thiobacillus denitrificans ATCC 25259]|uniref:Uncharacterized protein n=1 Tax=Thiobacillus denitrificans (strain ATCC 25259 / T1) TaxID=292415 RepID=Q3SKD5_THIDA|nr:hypothetical protein Tbd_0897 [Thiobacillus denitrificans ATCC 25259]
MERAPLTARTTLCASSLITAAMSAFAYPEALACVDGDGTAYWNRGWKLANYGVSGSFSLETVLSEWDPTRSHFYLREHAVASDAPSYAGVILPSFFAKRDDALSYSDALLRVRLLPRSGDDFVVLGFVHGLIDVGQRHAQRRSTFRRRARCGHVVVADRLYPIARRRRAGS